MAKSRAVQLAMFPDLEKDYEVLCIEHKLLLAKKKRSGGKSK